MSRLRFAPAVLAIADRARPGLTQTAEAVVCDALLVAPKHYYWVTVKPPSVSRLEQGEHPCPEPDWVSAGEDVRQGSWLTQATGFGVALGWGGPV